MSNALAHCATDKQPTMVDYSKWDNMAFDDDDDDATTSSSTSTVSTLAGPATNLADPFASLDLEAIKRDQPERLPEILRQIQEVKSAALAEKERHAASVGNRAATAATAGGSDASSSLSGAADAMRDQLAAIRRDQEKLEEQSARVEQLASAGDIKSVLEYMEAQGMDRGAIQRLLGGSDGDTDAVLTDHVEAQVPTMSVDTQARMDRQLEVADQVHRAIAGEHVDAGVGTRREAGVEADGEVDGEVDAEAHGGEAKRRSLDDAEAKVAMNDPLALGRPSEAFTVIPDGASVILLPQYQVQVKESKAAGAAAGLVEVEVALPSLSGIAELELDVSDWFVKVSAPVPADRATPAGQVQRYLIRFKLPRAVRSDEAKAKWLKKRSSLRLRLPLA